MGTCGQATIGIRGAARAPALGGLTPLPWGLTPPPGGLTPPPGGLTPPLRSDPTPRGSDPTPGGLTPPQQASRLEAVTAVAVVRFGLFGALFLGLARTWADPDLWGHLRFGRDIVH